MNQISW